MTTLTNLTIRSFRASNDEVTTSQYLTEHAKVLSGIGVAHAFRKDVQWRHDPNTILVIATTTRGRMIGGIRLQVHSDRSPIGMLGSIERLDPKVVPMFDAWARRGLGELCGLWVQPRYTGQGVARQLLIAAVSLADQLPMNTLVSFGAEYTARAIISTGFETINGLGDRGVFDFPTPQRQSYALINQHIRTCSLAPYMFRKQLLQLRRTGSLALEGSSLTSIPLIHFDLERRARKLSIVKGGQRTAMGR